MPEEKLSIYQLMPKIMSEIGAVSKSQKNEAQGYKFRGIDQFLNAAHPVLAKHGVFMVPRVLDSTTTERVLKNGSTALRVESRVSYTFYAPDGSYVDALLVGEGIDSSDKATNKSLSAALKYCLIQVFSIPTEDMDDGDGTSPEGGRARRGLPKDIPTVDKEVVITAPKVEEVRPIVEEENIDELPEIDFCTREQQDWLRLKFKDALQTKLQPHADQLRRDFLKMSGYVKADGTGSSTMIPRNLFKAVSKDAIKHAKEL